VEIRAETRPVPRAVAVTRQHANLQLRRSSAAAPSRIHNSKFSSYYSQHYSNSDLLFKFTATIQIRDMNSARALTGSGSTTSLFKASVAFKLKYFMHAG